MSLCGPARHGGQCPRKLCKSSKSTEATRVTWFSKIVVSCALALLAVIAARTKSIGSESADVSPIAFGAVCDGRRDDGAAFQAAIDLVAQRGGGSVLLPAATCFIDRTLVVGHRTTIRRSGPPSVLAPRNTPRLGPRHHGPTNR